MALTQHTRTSSVIDSKDRFLSIQQASLWASEHTNKTISPSNISYLIQYGIIKKYYIKGKTALKQNELRAYYKNAIQHKKQQWITELGEDLNWNLSFDHLRERDTTKHVHRLHPYKGKFIPQLVEYFIENHDDHRKKQTYFSKKDIILDPFCGSGTTLVQANESNIHALGIDVSLFNSLITNTKLQKYNIQVVCDQLEKIETILKQSKIHLKNQQFEQEISAALSKFNREYFPLEFKERIKERSINEISYGLEKEKLFLDIYQSILHKHKIQIPKIHSKHYLERWYFHETRKEIEILLKEIKKNTSDGNTRGLLEVILSKTARSCRATKHARLTTLRDPVIASYYCKKHKKICKPVISVASWWRRYSKDAIQRLQTFDSLRTDTYQICLQGDSRNIDLLNTLTTKHPSFASLVRSQKIQGIFSSPPYVGLIDYHEQHAYAYELFGYMRNDQNEIGPLFKKQGKKAREEYCHAIAKVLLHCKKYLADNYHVLLVANDKYDLYPKIANLAKMNIIHKFKRPVLNRGEDKRAYCESIFHMQEKP